MPSRFLNNITVNDSYTLPSADGSVDQIIQTDGAGNLSFVDLSSIEGAASNFVYFEVKNETGSPINKGKGVMAVGTDGNSGHILIDEMIADGSVESKYFLGVLETTVANGGFARVISFGQLDQFDTRGQNGETWLDGQILWCDPDSAGDFTITEPDGPNVKIAAAFILNSSTNGKIQVRVQANEGVHDLHDTKITSQVDGDVLVWDNTTGVWFNDSTLNVDYTAGNVGIGTTSPDTLLDVSSVNIGATAPTVRITNTKELGNWGGVTDDLGRFEFFTDDASGNAPYTLGYVGIKNDRTSGTLPSGAMVLATTTYNAAGGAVERMRITSDGDVGIGTTTPSYKLDVNGDGRVDGTFRCVTLVQTSQRDQKENINNIDKSKAKAIPFKEYTYKSSIDGSARKRYGVIAEDIENDYPELVHTGADGVKGINYIDLLVKRVAELEKELEDISLTPGATGPQGPSGSNGNDGNSHLSNVDSITFDERANQLVLTINRTDFRFSPVR